MGKSAYHIISCHIHFHCFERSDLDYQFLGFSQNRHWGTTLPHKNMTKLILQRNRFCTAANMFTLYLLRTAAHYKKIKIKDDISAVLYKQQKQLQLESTKMIRCMPCPRRGSLPASYRKPHQHISASASPTHQQHQSIIKNHPSHQTVSPSLYLQTNTTSHLT